MSITTLNKESKILLKGGMFTLTTIQLINNDLDDLYHQLDEKIKQAPNFFHYAPIILDVHRVPQQERLELSSLIFQLKNKKLIPIGLKGALKELKETAIQVGLAIFSDGKVPTTEETTSSTSSDPKRHTPSKLVTQPVRSGQQIYVPGGDLIVCGPVSNGAELLADGHIHVYGSMRGRALAGVMGDKDAMIFCSSLEAELISIAGQYRLSDDLKDASWKQSVCIQLQEDRLHIRPI